MSKNDRTVRIGRDWAKIAGEAVSIEVICGTVYGFCSEMGALRLEHVYRKCGDKAKAEYSENRKSWFFRLETQTGGLI